MLNLEKRFMIKDLYRKGVSISEIARQTGHDRKTIRVAVEEPLQAMQRNRPAKVRKIDPYARYLEERIGEGVLNGRKLYQEIVARGYPGKERQVRAFVQAFRQTHPAQASVRFETEPGQQAQVDWGSFGLIEHQDKRQRLYAFVMTLGWSRMMYLEFTVSMEAIWFLRCHLHAFRYFGGIPQEMLHDNLKTAVLGRDGEGAIHWNPRYLDFASYTGFRPRACQPYRAQTKGKVESGVKYVRGNFWPGLKYRDLVDLNQQAHDWLETVANRRMHGTTQVMPYTRLPLEHLQPLPNKPEYDTSLVSQRHSSRDCLVSYGSNAYSVPFAYAQQSLMVKETEAGELIVLSVQGVEVARHRLAVGSHQRILDPAHYQGLRTMTSPPKRSAAVQVPATSLAGLVLAAPLVEVRSLHEYEQMVEGVR